MRKDLEENEEAQAYMQALRGAGIRDYASAEGEMRLLEIEDGEAEGAGGDTDRLPLVYDPEALKDYFARRPQVCVGGVLIAVHARYSLDCLTSHTYMGNRSFWNSKGGRYSFGSRRLPIGCTCSNPFKGRRLERASFSGGATFGSMVCALSIEALAYLKASQ